ncbi:hypothetical protein NLJ89_g402 [Agrocybe chaxingu]|uniref:protein disulfide-isomerase n=1 Tax=Agrocybe chaxingu TaxID=84603 RepID=A0A9W8N1W4_9AGAR|nr:hypothetical protein NLJ89_g402 [Agrocybe chaxingu]
MRFSLPLFASALIAGVSASNVLELLPETFDSIIGKGTPALVEFFAPWCGHCKNLAPVYEQLADVFSHAKNKVIVAKVDADGAGKPLGKRFGVTGFPTLKWFDAEGKEVTYEEGRDLESLSKYITKKTGVKSTLPVPPPSDVVTLDLNNFNEIALDESKDVLVTFTAPWCGHCKNLKPHYEKVATTFSPEKNCIVANLDADDKKNADISRKYEVTGFPTIKFFPKGSSDKTPVDYEGGRTEADIVAYLNEKCGTQRAAGRHAEFDALAHKFFKASGSARDLVYKEAQKLAASAGALSKHYIRVMEKVANGSVGYIEKESKRLATILEKRNMSPAKLDEIKIKANVLKSFLEERVAEAKEKLGRAESEL